MLWNCLCVACTFNLLLPCFGLYLAFFFLFLSVSVSWVGDLGGTDDSQAAVDSEGT